MRRVFIFFLILLLSHVTLLADWNDDVIENLIREGVFESADKTFSNVPGADMYIGKYSLNSKELALIGSWVFDTYSNTLDGDSYGPGIGISFYPNRFFSILKSSRGAGKIESIIGEWKVKGDLLLLRFRGRIIRIHNDYKSVSNMFKVEYMDSVLYFPVFQVEKYESAYVNRMPFFWEKVPENYLGFYEINLVDKPRYRILFDPLGTPPGDIRAGTEGGELLLNPSIADSYFIRLSSFW